MRKRVFAYKSWINGWICMIWTHKTYINKKKTLNEGQGHKVKGQSVKYTVMGKNISLFGLSGNVS